MTKSTSQKNDALSSKKENASAKSMNQIPV
jgi:hypothetical protein